MSEALLGHRIHITGLSSAGKSTLGELLARALDGAFVDFDALNWLPDWRGLHERDPEELHRRIVAATSGDRWVLAGSYLGFCQAACWHRVETVLWLDLPMPLLLWRALRRSWRRWRSKELLWGTNREPFWPQLAVWRSESLLHWIATQHRRRRRQMVDTMHDPRWSHIRFIRLRSTREVSAFASSIQPWAGAGS